MAKDLDYWIDFFRRYQFDREQKILEQNWTPIETIAFLALDNLTTQFGHNNIMIHPQFKIGNYRVDFLIKYKPLDNPAICKQIIVECDGHEWHEKTKEQAARDKERDRFLVRQDYIVLRYTGSEIVNNPIGMCLDIEALLIPEDFKKSFGIKTNDDEA